MTVYCKLRINNIFSSDPDDLLAVFSGGKCVGVTKNVYNEANDLWYAFLTIYSKASVQDDLEFRIWDASTGKIFQGDRKSVVEGKSVSVRVDIGGRRIIKKKTSQ